MSETRPSDTILIVEDDAKLLRLLAEVLDTYGFRVVTVPDAAQALETLQREWVDLVLTDIRMPGMSGEQLLAEVRAAFPAIPVIGATAFGSPEEAAAMTRAGAADYLSKPFRIPVLLASLTRVLDETRARREQTRSQALTGQHPEGLIGRSRPMVELFDRIRRVGSASAPVLITGESGTGKELVARAVHAASGRGPFVAVDCGAIPTNLLESELFGHRRGAFTGADREKQGLFELAHGGTLLLDEIGELPLALQPKLLRVLQSGELRRVGEVQSRQVDVRVLAATHRDLEEEVRAGRFRDDLRFRINVLHLHLPPLRERRADIPLLAERFLEHFAAREGRAPLPISPAALAALVAWDWPGNVRELRNAVERAAVFADAAEIALGDLPEEIRSPAVPQPPTSQRLTLEQLAADGVPLDQIERAYVLHVLESVGGNRVRAAHLLGVPRRTLYRRLAEYGILAEE